METDHKLLIPELNNKHLIDMTPRIQRLRMRLLRFSFEAIYVKGAELNDAEAFSRAPHSKPAPSDASANPDVAFYVNNVMSNLPKSSQKLKTITKEANSNPLLLKIKYCVNHE